MTNEEAIMILKAMIDEMILVFDRDRKKALNMAIEALKAQLSNTSEIPNSSDLISRREALDALRDAENHSFNSFYQGLVKAHKIIADMPSAQPEQRWIPCSERLPEKNRKPNTFLVADSDGKLSISKFYFPLSNSDIEKPYWSGMIDVVAWMPLPEPYKDAQ